MIARRAGAVLGLAALLAAAASADGLDPERVRWSAFSMKARKLGLTATSSLEWRMIPLEEARRDLLVPVDAGALAEPTGEQLLFIIAASSLLGRDSESRLWLDPRDARIFQYEGTESGRRPRYKAYRYTHEGAWVYRKYPAPGEEKAPHGTWTDVQTDIGRYPGWSAGSVITEPIGLFYLIAAADLCRSGDRLEVLVVSKERVFPVEIRVREFVLLDADYARAENGTTRRVTATVPALRLSLTPKPPRGVTAKEFRMIGLEGSLDLWIDPQNRFPLQIAGRVRYAGRVVIRLDAVELSPAASAPQQPEADPDLRRVESSDGAGRDDPQSIQSRPAAGMESAVERTTRDAAHHHRALYRNEGHGVRGRLPRRLHLR